MADRDSIAMKQQTVSHPMLPYKAFMVLCAASGYFSASLDYYKKLSSSSMKALIPCWDLKSFNS